MDLSVANAFRNALPRAARISARSLTKQSGDPGGSTDTEPLPARDPQEQARSTARAGFDLPARDPQEQADRDYAPLSQFLGNAIHGLATLPQRMFGASEGLRTSGEYDPAPAVELMGSMYGMNAPFTSGLGVAGGSIGRRLGPSDFNRILAETRGAEGAAAQRFGPEVVQSAAVLDSRGVPFTGRVHNEAIDNALASGAKSDPAVGWYGSTGFMTNKGRFVDRVEAAQLAEKNSQVPSGYSQGSGYLRANEYKPLDAFDIASPQTRVDAAVSKAMDRYRTFGTQYYKDLADALRSGKIQP